MNMEHFFKQCIDIYDMEKIYLYLLIYVLTKIMEDGLLAIYDTLYSMYIWDGI